LGKERNFYQELNEHNKALLKALGLALSDLLSYKMPREKHLLERIKKLEKENDLLKKRNNELRKTILDLAFIIKK